MTFLWFPWWSKFLLFCCWDLCWKWPWTTMGSKMALTKFPCVSAESKWRGETTVHEPKETEFSQDSERLGRMSTGSPEVTWSSNSGQEKKEKEWSCGARPPLRATNAILQAFPWDWRLAALEDTEKRELTHMTQLLTNRLYHCQHQRIYQIWVWEMQESQAVSQTTTKEGKFLLGWRGWGTTGFQGATVRRTKGSQGGSYH